MHYHKTCNILILDIDTTNYGKVVLKVSNFLAINSIQKITTERID